MKTCNEYISADRLAECVLADDGKLNSLAALLVERMKEKNMTLSTAESCTGGLIGAYITEVSGASAVFLGGMMTYTNDVKIKNLGVSAETVNEYTEVSFETASEMSERAKEVFASDVGLSATGFAGPTGCSERDPVGTVYVGISTDEKRCVYRLSFSESADRRSVRRGAVCFVFERLLQILG